jgi:uncharacterized damage-inducible protein DinB
MTRGKTESAIDVLLQTYDQAYDKTAWHGTNLRGSLRGLKLNELLWRPVKGRHNIWEIALHCAYWKYVVWRRITGGARGAFPRKPSDWPKPPSEPNMKDWKEDFELLERWNQTLRDEIAQFPPSKLNSKPANSKVSFIQTIYGISSHDLYHAGQIQLLKRMARK